MQLGWVFLSLQEIILMCFSDVELFQLDEKETLAFVVLCGGTKMMRKGKHKQAGNLSVPAG